MTESYKLTLEECIIALGEDASNLTEIEVLEIRDWLFIVCSQFLDHYVENPSKFLELKNSL